MTNKMTLAQYRRFLGEGSAHSSDPGNNIKKSKKPNDLEHQHQCNLFEWRDLMVSRIPDLFFLKAIPNGGDRNPIVGAKLKKEGLAKGVPDVFWDVPRGGYHGFRAELKVTYENGDTNQPTDDQLKWIAHYKKNNYHADWYVGWEAVRDAILAYHALGSPIK